MKVVHIITRSDNVGGAQVHLLDLCKGLQLAGIQTTVLVGGEGEFTSLLRTAGLDYISIPTLVRPIRPWADMGALRQIVRILSRLQPDVVCTHSSKAGWLGRIAAGVLGIPSIHTAHGWAFTEGVPSPKKELYAVAEALVSRQTSMIITVSKFDRELAIRHKVGDPRKIVAIHNGVRDVSASELARPDLQPPRIIMVARLEPPKDPIALLRALAGLKDLAWDLDIVGDGPLRSAVQSSIIELGLERRVRLLGSRRDVARLLSQAQVFVLVSKWEGFPLSVLEAMRSRLPVIASDVGGVSEAVDDGRTGYLVKRGDEALLRERLKSVLLSPNMRWSMGEAGRSVYERRFRLEHMVAKTIQVYHHVIERGDRELGVWT